MFLEVMQVILVHLLHLVSHLSKILLLKLLNVLLVRQCLRVHLLTLSVLQFFDIFLLQDLQFLLILYVSLLH